MKFLLNKLHVSNRNLKNIYGKAILSEDAKIPKIAIHYHLDLMFINVNHPGETNMSTQCVEYKSVKQRGQVFLFTSGR